MWIQHLLLTFFLAVLLPFTSLWGQALTPPQRSLVVGTKEAPPFAMKRPDGTWEGISIELWQAMAQALNLPYELRELDLQGLLEGVAAGELDAAVAALTVTAAREKVMDFTHPFYTTGLGIAVARRARNLGLGVLEGFFSWPFVRAVAVLACVLFAVGGVVWWCERRRNPAHFGGSVAQGLGSGVWWAAVTMTTVGYGDKVPVTRWGRAVALVWMFASIITISGFTAAIATALTINQLGVVVRGPEDLARVRVGAIQHTTSEAALRERRLLFRLYPTPQVALEAIQRDEIDAVVYDAPLLRHLALTAFRDVIEVLPVTFERQDYAIALPPGSPLREALNRTLLEQLRRPLWQELLYRYLGKQG
ncbi:MAG: amino acid ABC transporter substrate-binding protein [Candidatus Tectimicrobiota bacterium]|nr:MAG: amino acid ABC transporter substrate-binding protein [Candidatus Tectomicrobia bacterium]